LMDTIMRSKKVPDHQLISLNRSIEHFYKQVQ
jgi:hypothetical protein